MNLFTLFNNFKIDLDADYNLIWKKIKSQYGLKYPYPEIYAITTNYFYGGGHTKYNQIEINGFKNADNDTIKISLHFFDDTPQSKLYTITLLVNNHWSYTLYDAQDKIKIKTICMSGMHSSLIKEVLKI